MGERAFARLSRSEGTKWSSDRRLARRRRTRLRSGRLFDAEGRFLLDCCLLDRSLLGARIATSYLGDLPTRIAFYDDEKREMSEADIVWREAEICGLIFRARPRSEAEIRARFGGMFHAMRNAGRKTA